MDSVTVAFELMRLELESETERLNAAGAAAFRTSNYEMAEQQTRKGRQLKDFCQRIRLLEDEWKGTFANDDLVELNVSQQLPPEETARTILAHSKSAKTSLIVRFSDGIVISERTAAETLAKALQKIGFEQVERLGVVVNGENIVSKLKSRKYNDVKLGDRYIKTHSSTSQKVRTLNHISDALGLNLEVRVID